MRFRASVFLSVLAFASPSFGAEGLYFEARGGLSIFEEQQFDFDNGISSAEVSFEPGAIVQVGGGYALPSGLRAEAWLGYQLAEVDDSDTVNVQINDDGQAEATSLMGNLYYDLELDRFGATGLLGQMTPFAGGGVGFTYLDLGGGDDAIVLGYNGVAGLRYEVNDRVGVSFQYMFLGTEDPDYGDFEGEFATHNLMAGVRVVF